MAFYPIQELKVGREKILINNKKSVFFDKPVDFAAEDGMTSIFASLC